MKKSTSLIICFILALVIESCDIESPPTTKSKQTRERETVFQVFPLAPRLRYTYRFFYQESDAEAGNLIDYNIDSGIVAYTIIDSSIRDDTSIVWSVMEVSTLRHIVFSLPYPTSDTNYQTIDTVMLPLIETTVGLHELTANGIVWGFPFWDSTIPVYRFATTSNIDSTFKFYNYGNLGALFELKLSDTKGLYYWSDWYISADGHNGTTETISAQLIGSPTLSIDDEEPPSSTYSNAELPESFQSFDNSN